MQPEELLRFLVDNLERLGLKYLVVGSTASCTFGESRFTHDIDVVVDLPAGRVADFCAAFPQDRFYVSAVAVAQAVRSKHQFNILHPETGLKVDVFVASDSAFDRSRFQRGRQVQAFPDRSVSICLAGRRGFEEDGLFPRRWLDKHLRNMAGGV